MTIPAQPSLAHLALIGVLYFAGAKLGMLTVMPEGNAVVWLSNAVVLAALLRFDGARLPAIGLVALAAEVAAGVPRFTLVEALLFGMINFAEAAGAFLLLRRVRFDARFTAVADVWKFVVGAIAASGCAALLGATVYSAFHGAQTTYFEFLRIWWFGDAVGLIVLTPLLLGFPPFRTMAFDAPSRWSRADLAMLLAAFVAVVAIWLGAAPLLGTLFFVLYVAWRAAPRWAAGAVALVAFFVVLVLASGREPFGELAARDAVVYVQRFLFVLSIVGLGFSTLLAQLRAQQAELERRVLERTQELEEANARLAELAAFDALSGAANRRNFDQALSAEALRSHRYGRPLAVILADIDRFKNVNDSHGHAAGDDVIRGVAATLAANCRRSDLVARYGGEEFAVLLPETGVQPALELAERLRQAIAGANYGSVGPITASFGVAELGPDGSAAELVQSADRALYEAKAQGRNRAVLSGKSRHSLPRAGQAE
jgi:diguanylate cyclase (GGDEF)-like protein